MPCTTSYVPVEQRSEEDLINERRDEALAQLEQELGNGTATIVQDPFTGAVTIEGASSVKPEGMTDICILDALNSRNTMEFQLAVGNAGLQNLDFAAMHGHSHHHH